MSSDNQENIKAQLPTGIVTLREVFPENLPAWSRENPGKLGILIFRLMMSVLWLSMAAVKLLNRVPDNEWDDFDHFKGQINSMGDLHPWPFMHDFILNVMVPNWQVLLVMVLITEITIGLTLGLGLFTRLGSFMGGGMAATLFILTLGWGEWIWTYPLIFMPHLLFFLARSGKDVGLDRVLEHGGPSLLRKLG